MSYVAVQPVSDGIDPPPAAARSGEKTISAHPGKRFVRLIIACSILLACAIVGSAGALIMHLRTASLADTERELRNMSLVLAEQTARSFEGLELVQSRLIERMSNFGIASEAELRERMAGYDGHVLLKDTINGLPHVESVAVFDPNGGLVNFSRAWPAPAINVAGREYFKLLTSSRHVTSAFGEPVLNKTTGTWSIYFARAFSAPDGALIGIIVGGMERRYFERYFSRIALGPDSTLSLLRRDNVPLAGYPQRDSIFQEPALKDLIAQSGGSFAQIAGRDGVERFVAISPVAHYPIVVAVGTSVDSALAGWRHHALYLAVAAIVAALAIGGITFLGIRRFRDYAVFAKERATRASADVDQKATMLVLRETERVHKLLQKQKIQLDTVLENMSQGVIMLDADARMLVCNNRYIEMYGMSPDVVMPGCTLRELIEHRATIGMISGNVDEIVRRTMAAIAKGTVSKTLTKLPDGRAISVCTQPMAEGGWVATHQDVTDQTRAEAEADRAQRFLLNVIENIPSTVIVKDARSMQYVLVNRAGEAFFGLARSEIMGRTPHDLFPEASADLINEHDQDLLSSNHEMRLEPHLIETPGNGQRLVTARRLAIPDATGKPQFLLSIIDDVTGRSMAPAD